MAEHVTHCAHCGRSLEDQTGHGSVEGRVVCHPRIPDGPDCYRLVTVYGEEIGTRGPATDGHQALKEKLDAVCNEVFTIADAFTLPSDRDEAGQTHIYQMGRREGLNQARFAVLRGLGVFRPNHTAYEVIDAETLHDLMCIAAYVSRGRRAVDVGVYPDALARRTLGRFTDEELAAVADQGEEQS